MTIDPLMMSQLLDRSAGPGLKRARPPNELNHSHKSRYSELDIACKSKIRSDYYCFNSYALLWA